MSHSSRVAVLAVVTFIALVGASHIDVLWVYGGDPVCVLPYSQRDQVIVSGGAVRLWDEPASFWILP
jgi:hypothetical protein